MTGYSPLNNLIVDLKKEILRLRKIEHAAWHVCESSEERVTDNEVVIDVQDFKKLADLLPLEHPAVSSAARMSLNARTRTENEG